MINDNEYFEGKRLNEDRLTQYGFIQKDGVYRYNTVLPSCGFDLQIDISADGKVCTEVRDNELNEEYTLHMSPDAVGAFVGGIRTDYCTVLQEISDRCFDCDKYRGKYTEQVMSYISAKYGDEIEYLWKDDPSGIWRRKDNSKWYAALLYVKPVKLGLKGDEPTQILDLRIDPIELDNLVDGKRYFRGYHMNKKTWMTVCLDGSVELNEILQRIDNSYILAADKKSKRTK